jgi:peroxiredoxin
MKISHAKTFLQSMATARVATLAVVYLAFSTIALSGADETGIILSGTYEYSVNLGSRTPQYSATFDSQAAVADRAWIIRYEQTADSRNAANLNTKVVASCDGTNIYVVKFQNKRTDKKVWGDRYASVKDELPVAMATIYPGDYPPSQEFALQNIWRAFASSSVFTNSTGKAKPPGRVDFATFYDPNYYCDYCWTTNDTEPGQRLLIFKTDGNLLREVEINRQSQHVKLAKPSDDGFTNGVGLWKQVTNIAGLSVPTEFDFTQFGQAQRGVTTPNGAGALRTLSTYRCTVTNVATAAMPAMPTPLPKGRVYVTDHRFEKLNAPEEQPFVTTTGEWIPDKIDLAALAASQGVNLNVGDTAPDFTFKTFDGKQLRLSDLRGKYVLLDFWATICVPCIKEIPELTATYEAFGKDKQFTLVSLSLDTAEAEPRKFVAAKGLRWTQGFLHEQLKASVQQAYGFTAIPQVLLIGPDGRIVQKHLQGATIQHAVASALPSR